MRKYKFPIDPMYNDVFTIFETLNGTYVCPGWYPVEPGTTRDHIKFEIVKHKSPKLNKDEMFDGRWEVEASKPGKFYEITHNQGIWTCSCPAKTFHRGDCKHIKKIKTRCDI